MIVLWVIVVARLGSTALKLAPPAASWSAAHLYQNFTYLLHNRLIFILRKQNKEVCHLKESFVFHHIVGNCFMPTNERSLRL